jgi:hypothetical protein
MVFVGRRWESESGLSGDFCEVGYQLSQRKFLFVVVLLSIATLPFAHAQAEDSMSNGELEEMIDDIGGGQNATPSTFGLSSEDASVDQETYDHATPEPLVEDRPAPRLSDPPTPIPSGDKYNSKYGKKKMSKKSVKKKIAKSRGSKKFTKKREVASKGKKKSRDRRISRR